MPAPGDQHTAVTNPFEEPRPRVAEWAAKDIATISAKLDKQLGPEYISARAGPGGTKVHYLTAEKCITLANEVFGFNGWSSSIQNIQVDFADENPQTQRVSIGLSVIVRITLRDGTYHEDIGYGSIENAKGKAMAFEKAKKEGTTDGLKRALRNFGNVLGNCIYDKDYVKQVTKMKAEPVKKFDQGNLHRHADFIKRDPVRPEPAVATSAAPAAPMVKSEPAPPLPVAESFDDYLGELDEADFCVPEDGHPDEIMLSTSILGQPANDKAPNKPTAQQIQPQPGRSNSTGPPNRAPQTPIQGQQRPNPSNAHSNRPQGGPSGCTTPNPIGNLRPPPNAPQNIPETVGFFSAKAVNQLPESTLEGSSNARLSLPQGQQAFNPKAESPSIRKTPGIDHTSSKPVAKNGQHVAPTNSQVTSAPAPRSNTSSFTPVRPSIMPSSQSAHGNVINPSLDQTRRIGAPSGPGSPLANRGSYRPPAMKRPPPGDGRTALADLPANGNGGTAPTTANGVEAKRQKMA
ncbi:DNA repair and recombination protein RAD52 [Fusarium austroafricanum]|uniref:RAD52 homolog n=1 Tax=Fusarium austroafricanum TaxID=2364996 RepID=A0A8H4JT21_9HYPO|nr:DNA repair and recombination protein RAD52 [Fusarium austroafricanum]